MNQITHWLDSSNVYGSGKDVSGKLRTFSGGRLLTEKGVNGESMLPDDGTNSCRCKTRKCFLAGKYK